MSGEMSAFVCWECRVSHLRRRRIHIHRLWRNFCSSNALLLFWRWNLLELNFIYSFVSSFSTSKIKCIFFCFFQKLLYRSTSIQMNGHRLPSIASPWDASRTHESRAAVSVNHLLGSCLNKFVIEYCKEVFFFVSICFCYFQRQNKKDNNSQRLVPLTLTAILCNSRHIMLEILINTQ